MSLTILFSRPDTQLPFLSYLPHFELLLILATFGTVLNHSALPLWPSSVLFYVRSSSFATFPEGWEIPVPVVPLWAGPYNGWRWGQGRSKHCQHSPIWAERRRRGNPSMTPWPWTPWRDGRRWRLIRCDSWAEVGNSSPVADRIPVVSGWPCEIT